MSQEDDLWTRLGWRRATALSIHFFPTLHPTALPCLTYSEGAEQIYMFAIGENGPYAWPARGEPCPKSSGIPERARVVAFFPNEKVDHITDWPNAMNASTMLALM